MSEEVIASVGGEVRIAAESGGRSLERESVTTGHTDVPVRFYRAEDTMFCGFRQPWIAGENENTGVSFDLLTGVGSRYMVLEVEVPGRPKVREYVDMVEVLNARLDAIVAEEST